MSDFLQNVALYAHPQRLHEAERLAHRFNLPFDNRQGKSKYRLYLGLDRLELHNSQTAASGPVYIDFVAGRNRHRRLFGGGKRQPLARAAGIKGSYLPEVIDGTAGFGRDAFVLASLGCKVTMIERSPVLAALLYDALERASLNEDVKTIANRMTLLHIDSITYLQTTAMPDFADTLYLDPMYPHCNKSALAKKEMRIARELSGDDNDAKVLLRLALATTRARVVVKRPRTAGRLGDLAPATAIFSRNTRYDIYLPGSG